MVSEYDVNVNSIKNNITKNTEFLTAILCIAENPERIKNIFADSFARNEYGIYKVIVNINGIPKEIVLDDYIPVYSPSNRPVFCKISHKNQDVAVQNHNPNRPSAKTKKAQKVLL